MLQSPARSPIDSKTWASAIDKIVDHAIDRVINLCSFHRSLGYSTI